MDKNINYKTFLNNSIVSKYIKNDIDDKIIKYINDEFDFSYKVIYLRNKADAECMICYNKNKRNKGGRYENQKLQRSNSRPVKK